MEYGGSPTIDAQERIVLYLSGGGYRATLASIGAVGALGTAGRWPQVRKIVSVSGGGILNAWLMLKRPETAEELADVLDELTARLMNRRRSGLNIALAVLSAAAVILAIVVGGIALWKVPIVSYLAIFAGPFVGCWAVLGLAPWVFLTREFNFLGRMRGGSLRGEDWHREHVFVASDLLAGGPVSFICHRQGALMDAPRRGVFGADHIRIKTMLRASTALPPVLPPIHVRTGTATLSTIVPSMRKPAPGRGVWLVDGGVTGNLGIQADTLVTNDLRRSEDEVRDVRLQAANSARTGDAFAGIMGDLSGLVALSEMRSRAHKLLVENTLVAQSGEATQAGADFFRDPENANLLAAAASEFNQPIARSAQPEALPPNTTDGIPAREQFSRAMERHMIDRGVLQESSWDLFDSIRKQMRLEGPTVGNAPDCGHTPVAWSLCELCTTSIFVVDASGADPRPTQYARIAMWIPGIATALNAIQTMRVQYAGNLRADRTQAQQHVVSVVRPAEIYERVARVTRASSHFQRRFRWLLAEDILPSLSELMSESDYLRSELAKMGAQLVTSLTAPTRKHEQIAAQGVLAGGFVNMYLQLASQKTPNELINDASAFSRAGMLSASVRKLVKELTERRANRYSAAVAIQADLMSAWRKAYQRYRLRQTSWEYSARQYQDYRAEMDVLTERDFPEAGSSADAQ